MSKLHDLEARGKAASAPACPECEQPLQQENGPFWSCEPCMVLWEYYQTTIRGDVWVRSPLVLAIPRKDSLPKDKAVQR